MNRAIRVAAPPPKPLVVFDGACNFCKLWIARWRQITGDAVEYRASQEPGLAAQFPEIPVEDYARSVQLVEPDGTVFSGAEAVFRTLVKNPRWQWPLHAYEASPALANITECAYGFVAGHRTFFSLLTRVFWGRHVERPQHFLTRWVFLRALGAIYLVAFVSLWMQLGGLMGHNGILPADQLMSSAKQACDARGIGIERYHLLPTLCWWDASDSFLNFQCVAGTVLAVLLMAGIAPAPCLTLLWLIYLSLSTVGRDFLGFQWDNLLLEAGFVAIFFAPLQWLPRGSREAPPSRIALWLLRLLLFKLVFSSGCVKLLSGDPTWRDLTALTFHYQTQPLPTAVAWYANQLPLWFQKFSCATVFAIELGAPWLIWAPRRIRFIGGAVIAALQVLIILSGNYTFFNFLTLALGVVLLDDFVLQKFVPRKLNAAFLALGNRSRWRWPRWITIPVAIPLVAISLLLMLSMTSVRSGVLAPIAAMAEWAEPLRIVNSYGLFAVMTTARHEIVVEGSDDGLHWLPYGFKYKPGDLNHQPRVIEPFQPRLDWQMWFAALGDYRENPWFESFCERLLQGSPEVLALLKTNPFPGRPPRLIRAELYDYHFTDFAERRATGAWWKRELIGEYLPPVSLHE